MDELLTIDHDLDETLRWLDAIERSLDEVDTECDDALVRSIVH